VKAGKEFSRSCYKLIDSLIGSQVSSDRQLNEQNKFNTPNSMKKSSSSSGNNRSASSEFSAIYGTHKSTLAPTLGQINPVQVSLLRVF
jgi:hypothetical protein